MSEGRGWRRTGSALQRARGGSLNTLTGRTAVPRFSVGIANAKPFLHFDRLLAAEIDRYLATLAVDPQALIVVTDIASLVVRANRPALQALEVCGNDLVGKNICELIGSQDSDECQKSDRAMQGTTALGSLSCIAVKPIQLSGRRWLIWELATEVTKPQRPEPGSASTEIADRQFRIDPPAMVVRQSTNVSTHVTRIDRRQAVMTLEAETYRGAVQRLTSLMGQLDLLALSTARLERRLSAAGELQPMLTRAMNESKQVAESVVELHSLHRSYLPKLQWCDLSTLLCRCCMALARDLGESEITLQLSDDATNYRIHVDTAALGRAVFWLVFKVVENLSQDDRTIQLRSDCIADEIRLRATFRCHPAARIATGNRSGVLQIEDGNVSQGPIREVSAATQLKARWTIETRADDSSMFDLFIRCPKTEL